MVDKFCQLWTVLQIVKVEFEQLAKLGYLRNTGWSATVKEKQ